MALLYIDPEKCTRCGACADVCPTGVIAMGDGGPEALKVPCIACGHCVAVCPHGALDHEKAPMAQQTPLEKTPVLDAETAARFLRARRSIRCYKPEPAPREKILQLLDIARMAPTGGNSQGVSYHVIESAHVLRAITAATVDWMEAEVQKGAPWAAYFAGTVEKHRKTGHDVILRGAPSLIVALTPTDFLRRGRDNAHFSLTYAELFAPSIGLGTCWAGFFESCASTGYAPLLDLLALPEDKAVVGGLMVGYPQYTYRRLVDRNPLQVTWQ
ncbi:4Fe-4S dicluster domain-containing protein [Heliobacterium gestii]|uniref:4Fe-4S dicluster domain-containing protein n=1 Tax=Heliomicrobium gestii TaxID=2699 RepID=A0A845LD82_HELGE|nr:nitroreductase family protein [Heliomicrobium gestii]MBM7866324.1 nitroreductase/NAD-dependent dihydropyrimidine dehydrogenase PreA subunit [Heliomicrobium gestii]MZP42890.1 4Fe-4S dicluster domain-containing protein [Heliomicrobium gestii]